MKMKNPAAVALGSIKSPRKAKTSAENGKLGGRPKSRKKLPIYYVSEPGPCLTCEANKKGE